MTERESIIERLKAVDLGGGSHAMLSAICKAVLPHGDAWTLRRCADLRDRLVRLLGEVDTPHSSDGRITDELRKWIRDGKGSLADIADRIDAAHQKAIASVMNDALYHANDKDMADLGWVRLPKDADGEYIHIGDEVEEVDHDGHNSVFELRMLEDGWWVITWGIGRRPDKYRHHHAPTVEDVLREFICDHEEGVRDEVDLIAEYAKRLKLAGSDAE